MITLTYKMQLSSVYTPQNLDSCAFKQIIKLSTHITTGYPLPPTRKIQKTGVSIPPPRPIALYKRQIGPQILLMVTPHPKLSDFYMYLLFWEQISGIL